MAKDILQYAAISEVIELVDGIDAADQRNALQAAVGRDDLGDKPLMRLEIGVQSAERHLLVALQAERLPGRALLEYQRHHAHADQIGAMDAFKRLRDHRAHAEQDRALGGPVARGAGAVFLAGEYDQRHVLALVAHRRVVDRHALARRDNAP